MEEKIFLEINRSVRSNNINSDLDVGLSGKMRYLPDENISKTLSLLEQYNKERDECNKYRLILTVNPICSNILFNTKTEIVVNEGSDDCEVLYDGNEFSKPSKAVNTTNPVTYRQAIADTEYSHKKCGNFVYHCGVDIFNNHMLRAQEFGHVNKINGSTESYPVYNTIRDYLRDSRGNTVEEDIHTDWQRDGEKVKMHLYRFDSVLSMDKAFYERCKERDGWWGFVNPGNIEIPNSNDASISINRMMANNKPCEFIDLYPDRSLFSFIPKYNKFRQRTEKNWDYCITYPYKSDAEKINTICGGENQAIRCEVKVVNRSTFTPRLQCTSYFKHNLSEGEYVRLYYYYPEYSGETVTGRTFQKVERKLKVVSLGDANGQNRERVFNISYSDVEDIYAFLEEGCFYKKISHDTECKYYFRIFKKLKTLGGVEELKSDINKSAYSRNIYGDETAQILYLDDVDVTGMVDNNGAPLTEVYLTILKRNAGNELWYKEKDFTSEDVEFSHCFGKVTSALDFSGMEDEPFDYNIHYLHNLNKYIDESNTTYAAEYDTSNAVKNTFAAWGETINDNPTPKVLENDLTIDNDEFYGDVVEFDIYNCKETVIGDVYHRFNTKQRETFADEYRDIYNDTIVSDDYDYANGSGRPFIALTYYVNDVVSTADDVDGNVDLNRLMYGNISPEGYYYKPHNRIKIRETEENAVRQTAKEINYSECSFGKGDYYMLKIKVPTNYGFYSGDFIAAYDVETGEIAWGEIMSFSDMMLTIRFSLNAFSFLESEVRKEYFLPNNILRRFHCFWSSDVAVPFYAKFSPTDRKFVWNRVIPQSELTNTQELFDIPFSNGRLYLENKINFFLRRQDPTGKYGLSIPKYKKTTPVVPNPMSRFVIQGNNPIDLSQLIYFLENSNTCY